MACPTLHTPTSAVPSVASIWPWALFSLISGLLGPSGITTASTCVFPVGHEKAERFLNTLFSQGLTTESGWACGKIEAVDPRILATSKLSSPSLHIPHFVDQGAEMPRSTPLVCWSTPIPPGAQPVFSSFQPEAHLPACPPGSLPSAGAEQSGAKIPSIQCIPGDMPLRE